MRFSGQGMMSHTASTTISRYFTKSRGKALSAGWFGLSCGEFILPVLIVYLLTFYSWQNIWLTISIIVIIFLPTASYFLVKNLNLESRELDNNQKNVDNNIKQWTRLEVLKDYRFYVISLNMLAMPWIATGVFVYQSFVSNSKGWGEFTIAQSFMSYSILTVSTLLLAGPLIDKFSSRKLLIYMNIPLLISTFVIILFDASITAFVFLGLIGVSNGFANILGSATWAEIYGVKHIGSIKALTTALMVFSTAFGTALFGVLIDNSFSIENIATISAIYISTSLVLLFLTRKKLNPVYI